MIATITKYISAGLLTRSLSYLFYIVLVFLGLLPLAAHMLCWFMGVVINFNLNRLFIFKARGRIYAYIVLMGIIGILNYLLFNLLSTFVGIPIWILPLIISSILYPIHFIINRRFIFQVASK